MRGILLKMWRRRKLHQDLEAELAFHRDMVREHNNPVPFGATTLIPERLIATLSGFFGALALLLAAIGLYGVIAYAIQRRTREIGIRMALGARQSAVIWMVLRSALVMAIAGIAIGLILSSWLARLVTAQLYGVSPNDPMTLATACAVLAAVALLAASVPAWKAARVDPMVALRYE